MSSLLFDTDEVNFQQVTVSLVVISNVCLHVLTLPSPKIQVIQLNIATKKMHARVTIPCTGPTHLEK